MLAKNLFNCKVIGSCGGPVKCALIKEKVRVRVRVRIRV
jgi:NADPH-dependent curcumin reductase CurA